MSHNGSVFSIKSAKPPEKVCDDLERAVVDKKFGVMAKHDLKAIMAKKGVSFDRECRVFEVCNPHQAKSVLETDMAVSTALPCRISIYSEGDKTVLSTIRPTTLLKLVGNGDMGSAAEDVEVTIAAIMDEAAR